MEGNLTRRFDAHDVDLTRAPRHTANRKFLYDRSREILGLLYDIAFPYLQLESARPLRTTPLHDRLKDRGAFLGKLRAGKEQIGSLLNPKKRIPV